MNDTSPAALARYHELLREAGPHRRLEICAKLSQATRELALAGLRRERPHASASELRHDLAERLYGQEIADRYFPADDEHVV